jgi:hypothetical protein
MTSDRDQRKLRAYARSFRKRNGQSPTTGTVHAVSVLAEWLGVQIALPRPACGTGIGGATGNPMTATTANVSCLRCLASPTARKAATHRPEPVQLVLGEE